MDKSSPPDSTKPGDSRALARFLLLLAFASLLVVLVGLFQPTDSGKQVANASAVDPSAEGDMGNEHGTSRALPPARRSRASAKSAPTAEEIVAAKVAQFGRNRRAIVRAIGLRLNKEVPPEVEALFDAIESGNWDDIDAQWKAMAQRSGQYEGSGHSPELDPFWATVLDAYGVAEAAHLWPAQKLLDYGNEVLGALRPGMVYVGGTDPGRWIPTLLNETGNGDPHVVVTQNALADSRYLEFVSTLYDGRMATLTQEDSQKAFQDYVADAQRRLLHDRQFPDEPKQVRPGEDIKMTDGHVQVSGQVAVMAINERLLEALMRKNPDLSFAIEESAPLKGTYADALPLGPLMELNAKTDQNGFTEELANQSLDYWRTASQRLLSDPEALGSPETMKSYSHDAVAAANLLAANSYTAEAEQAFGLASQMWPGNPEPVGGLAQILANEGRLDEARQMLDDFARKYPDQHAAVDLWRASIAVGGATNP